MLGKGYGVPPGFAEPSEVAQPMFVGTGHQTEARDAAASTLRSHHRNSGILQVVHGAKRVAVAGHELHRAAVGMVDVMVKPPYPAIGALDSLEGSKLAAGVTYRVLYDRSALAHRPQLEVTERLVARGEQARVAHAAPTQLVIVDNEVAMLPLTMREHVVDSALIIRSSEMLVSVRRIFDEHWRFAAPFTMAPRSPLTAQPSEQERWILSLLASGATDDAIGRLMGLSARTAHRRVRELISRLGAETRFQAGMRAVQLGWL
jgi:DNA-binding NarL/FixJ family response regulator